MPQSIRPGDVLAARYRLVDLLSESGNGRFWRAHDRILERHVALHVIAEDDGRAAGLVEAARRSATVPDRRVLRVLDAERTEGFCYVVNEWGSGTSLDVLVATHGPLPPRQAAWLVGEVADTLSRAHAAGVAHGRLVPENVLIDRAGAVRVIGLAVDAALHGLPPDRTDDDLTDLAGLLYWSLTGRWAGCSPSGAPPALRENGRLLRPRQVRAGVPRPLDTLCDEVLNAVPVARGRELRPAYSARVIADLLADFVGDPTGIPDQLAVANAHRGPETVVLPPVPDLLLHQPDQPPAPEPPAPTTATPKPAAPEPPELATQAGMPVFDDEPLDDQWYAASSEAATPPPPFDAPPERPLFAPEPSDGTPPRRPRPDRQDRPSGDEYWPWDTGRGTGTGLTAIPEEPDAGAATEVPGRSWLRLAAGLGAGLLLLVAVVVAVNLGRGKTPLGAEPDSPPSRSPSESPSAPVAIPDLAVSDLDPQGDGAENPESTALTVDGDPATTWRSSTYLQQLGPAGLKTGVGLQVDLGAERDVAQVGLSLVGEPTEVAVYVTDEAVSDVAGLEPVLTEAVGPDARIELEEPVRGRFVTLWFTGLPGVDGGFRAEVAEVAVRG
ncbi:protein kinase family protein [Nocardioides pantholopis]|uniref:protein kinase family protein n=1 Tax=Nocardioides pantholopis TaxID=2483798 RepID=UPI0013DE4077|nr:protein kinase family protein [Nocardioides pantholopis]